jgi:hypothetical protein
MRGFETAIEYFDFTYLIKVDTDTYVNVPKFIDYIVGNGAGKSPFYAGAQGLVFEIKKNIFVSHY